MSYLYLDIETIATQDVDTRQRIAAEIKPPASMSKAETIARWEAEQKADAIEAAIAKTALDGAAGHIICIGYAVDGGEPMACFTSGHIDEDNILKDFFEALAWRPYTIVGHNIAWDLRFITQRAIVLGVRLPGWWPRDIKPWSPQIFCTQAAWAGPQDRISLDRLCRTLGIAGKGDVTGADVGGLWLAGKAEAIALYCLGDVGKTRAIHRKMMIAFGEIPAADDADDADDDDAAFLAELGK